MRMLYAGVAGCLLALTAPHAAAAPPVTTDPRLAIELVAAEPDIVTPTGIAVDPAGRVWVVENHTHQRPKDYKGPPTDHIRILDDFDPETGKARRVITFAYGFQNTMSLALGKDGVVYVATRAALYRLRANKNAGAINGSLSKPIVRLDTPGDYPHNGLSGFAFDAQGNMYFGLGENLGAPYRLIGSDGTTLSGGGEGGSIYRCRPDGSKLERLATGFWNPFHMAFDAFGRLWAVDNDPDARGPCRLLHIVRGGDYGYRFRYGRKGLHPFVAWDGELPGTLPMAAGTAEAPSGILAYEAAGFPAEYRGQLFVTSWGDHVVERFTTAPRGASFSARGQILVRGGDDFRPVGIAVAPNGDVYLSDWVDSSYPVHGKGRIWRIRPKRRAGEPAPVEEKGTVKARVRALAAGRGADWLRALGDAAPEVRGEATRLLGESRRGKGAGSVEKVLLDRAVRDTSPFVRMQAVTYLRAPESLRQIIPLLEDADPYLISAALTALGRTGNTPLLREPLAKADARLRLGLLLALRRTGDAAARELIPNFLRDDDPAVRRAAVQWVAEERLRDLAGPMRDAALRPPVTRELLEAYLAAAGLLAGKKGENPAEAGQAYVAAVVADAKYPAEVRALALRMTRPDHPKLRTAALRDFLKVGGVLAREAARALAARDDLPAHTALLHLAGDANAESDLRADAVLGLARRSPLPADTRRFLLESLQSGKMPRDVLRSLRGPAGEAAVRQAVLAWWDKRQGHPLPPPDTDRELAEQVLLLFRGAAEKGLAERLRPVREAAGARPDSAKAWREALRAPGDARAGERVFFHPDGPRCFLCHRIDGRGGEVGPDLSRVGAALSRERLLDSILEPSKEVAPRYTNWLIVTRDGKTRTGVIVGETNDSKLIIADAQGKLETIPRLDVEERRALPTSIMPADLPTLMTRQEFRDLLAFLEGRK